MLVSGTTRGEATKSRKMAVRSKYSDLPGIVSAFFILGFRLSRLLVAN